MKCIRQALRKDKAMINRLRITEFRRSSEFDLLLAEQLKWNQCDEDNIVLAAWANGCEAVSTMRAILVNNPEAAGDCLQCTIPDRLAFPALVFSAAATRKSYRGQGLNQAIRYHFLEAAIRFGIANILSPIYEGAPRIDFMKSLGYRFVKPRKNWQTKLLPKSDRILGILPREEMGRAIDQLKAHRGRVLTAYPWCGAPIVFPVKTMMRVR